MKAKPTPQPPTGADMIRVIDKQLRALDVRRLAVIEEIIAIEKSSVGRSPDTNAAADRAEALLAGGKFVNPPPDPLSQLESLRAERATIGDALRIGASRQHRLAVEIATEIYGGFYAEICEIERQRVLTALGLQRIDRAREKLKEKIEKAGGGMGFLPSDGREFLGRGDVHDDVSWAANRLIADGIMTEREVAKARADG